MDTSLLKLCSLFADTYGVRRQSVNPFQSEVSINTLGATMTIRKWLPQKKQVWQ
jgi:hypothetical protein